VPRTGSGQAGSCITLQGAAASVLVFADWPQLKLQPLFDRKVKLMTIDMEKAVRKAYAEQSLGTHRREPEKKKPGLEQIISDLYASEIDGSIAWTGNGGIDVKLGFPLYGYCVEKVRTVAEATAWLRDQTITYYPDSEFARKYGGSV
jgi:hypothetical protein